MKGITYLTDNKNKKVAVQIDLSKYGELWEDFLDLVIANEREKEDKIPLEDFIAELKAEGKLGKSI
ncbi:MAG TPA: hypothetical protein PKL31_05795 [Fulvivirga sp.]|nr:hypothetical protein [Fulvivirga sp.]